MSKTPIRDGLAKVVGSILSVASLVSLPGCVSEEPYYLRQCPPQVTRTYRSANFFTCNREEDRNQNGVIDPEEYIGIKNEFRSFEEITIVGTVLCNAGARMNFRLLGPRGELVTNAKEVVPFNGASVRYHYYPHEISDRCGQGYFKIEFYLEDSLINTSGFTITK